MTCLYCEATPQQLKDYKDLLHKKIFWLLLYKDPKTKDKYAHVDCDVYFDAIMREIGGLNTLLDYPGGLIEVLSTLQAAYDESKKEEKDFNYKVYRKFVLDAHSLLDRVDWGEGVD